MSRTRTVALATLISMMGAPSAFAQGTKADSTAKKPVMQGKTGKSVQAAAKLADDAPAPTKKIAGGGPRPFVAKKSTASGKRMHDESRPKANDGASKDPAKMTKARKRKADSTAKKP
jgi:hypothetical protein